MFLFLLFFVGSSSNKYGYGGTGITERVGNNNSSLSNIIYTE